MQLNGRQIHRVLVHRRSGICSLAADAGLGLSLGLPSRTVRRQLDGHPSAVRQPAAKKWIVLWLFAPILSQPTSKAPRARPSPGPSTIHLMIALLRGLLIEKHPNQAIVETGGVGYDVTIPVSTFTRLPDPESKSLAHPYHVREDALSLYGFLTQTKRPVRETHRRERHRAQAGRDHSLRPGRAGFDRRHPARRSG